SSSSRSAPAARADPGPIARDRARSAGPALRVVAPLEQEPAQLADTDLVRPAAEVARHRSRLLLLDELLDVLEWESPEQSHDLLQRTEAPEPEIGPLLDPHALASGDARDDRFGLDELPQHLGDIAAREPGAQRVEPRGVRSRHRLSERPSGESDLAVVIRD